MRFLVVSTAHILVAPLLHFGWANPHYAAPALPLIVVLHVQAFRLWMRGRAPDHAAALAWGIAVSCLCAPLASWHWPERDLAPWRFERQRLQTELERTEGFHLILVRYADGHFPPEEWIHNGPTIDSAKVVWARDFGLERNVDLLEHFSNRTIWRLTVGAVPGRLIPYEAGRTQSLAGDP
jgi:hypothetical protein